MAAERSVVWVKKVIYFGGFCSLYSHCIRKSISLMFMSSRERGIYAFVAKLSDRSLCWSLAAMLLSIRIGTNSLNSFDFYF